MWRGELLIVGRLWGLNPYFVLKPQNKSNLKHMLYDKDRLPLAKIGYDTIIIDSVGYLLIQEQ